MIERIDSKGRWESHDNGRSWVLLEPTQAWLDERALEAEPEQNNAQLVLELLSNLSPEQLQRVITLGLAVTEPEAVETLEQAVALGDAVTGVAVVAEAASAAQPNVATET